MSWRLHRHNSTGSFDARSWFWENEAILALSLHPEGAHHPFVVEVWMDRAV
jgi:hypothetical protein